MAIPGFVTRISEMLWRDFLLSQRQEYFIPLTLLLLQTQHNLTNHPLHKYPPCALFPHLVKPQFHHLWRLLTTFPWSEGIGAPFLSRISACLAQLYPAMEHLSEANTWMPATKFFSGMQAHCVFEIALSFLHRNGTFQLFPSSNSKGLLPPLAVVGVESMGRGGVAVSTDEAGSGGASPWIHAISRVWLGSSDLQRPSGGQGQWYHCMTFPKGKLSPTAFLWKSLVFRRREEGNFALCLC